MKQLDEKPSAEELENRDEFAFFDGVVTFYVTAAWMLHEDTKLPRIYTLDNEFDGNVANYLSFTHDKERHEAIIHNLHEHARLAARSAWTVEDSIALVELHELSHWGEEGDPIENHSPKWNKALTDVLEYVFEKEMPDGYAAAVDGSVIKYPD